MKRAKPSEWVRYGAPCGGLWVHPTGCMVQHCGHPTALWPYYGILPDGREPMIWFPSGFLNKKREAYRATPKWAYLHECQEWILRVHRGGTPELFEGEELDEIWDQDRQKALALCQRWEGQVK